MANFFAKIFGSKKEDDKKVPAIKQEEKKVIIEEVVEPEPFKEAKEEIKPVFLWNNDVRRIVELGKSWGMLIYIIREDDSVFVDGPKDKVAEAVAGGAKAVGSDLYSIAIKKVIWRNSYQKINEFKGKVKKQGFKMVKIEVTKPTELEFTGIKK